MEIFVAILLVFLVYRSVSYNLKGIYHSLLALRWDSVDGFITYSSLNNYRSPYKRVKVYELSIWYAYQHNGKDYTSKRFAFNYSNNSFSFIGKMMLWNIRRNRNFKVYVNPLDSKDAVLIRGLTLFHVVNLCLPIISGPFKRS